MPLAEDGRQYVELHPEVRLFAGPSLALCPMRKAGFGTYPVWGGWQERPVDDWARLWGLPVAALVRRLKDPKGCWPAMDLMLPVHEERLFLAKRDGIAYGSEHKSVAEWAAEIGITEFGLLARLRNPALNMAQVFRRPGISTKRGTRFHATAFTYQGVTTTLKGHCDRLGLKYATVYMRTRTRTINGRVLPALTPKEALDAGKRKSRRDAGKPRKVQSEPATDLQGTVSN